MGHRSQERPALINLVVLVLVVLGSTAPAVQLREYVCYWNYCINEDRRIHAYLRLA